MRMALIPGVGLMALLLLPISPRRRLEGWEPSQLSCRRKVGDIRLGMVETTRTPARCSPLAETRLRSVIDSGRTRQPLTVSAVKPLSDDKAADFLGSW
ncbi:MAG: hypothetical protein A2Y74_01805 [Actinobacteria bacterium RBG_13_63_9]|nr:MAG: hypothetical protein A2Y74_01805 [Actinobacteria bacterium RBG_13_63_9]